MARWVRSALAAAAALGLALASARADDPDPAYRVDANPRLALPTYAPGDGPLVRVDEAHGNVKHLDLEYRPFGELLEADGQRVEPFPADWAWRPSCLEPGGPCLFREKLAETDVLVVPTPSVPYGVANPSADEIAAFVAAGGGLLLILDHTPVDLAGPLLDRFGVVKAPRVGTRGAIAWQDPRIATLFQTTGEFLFHRGDGTLLDPHPLTGPPGERVEYVLGTGGVGFREGELDPLVRDYAIVLASPANPAVGQGVAFRYGEGRVFLGGDAGMFTAQVNSNGGTFERRFICFFNVDVGLSTRDCDFWYAARQCDWHGMYEHCTSLYQAGDRGSRMGYGMHKTRDNEQFILNVMRWLAGTLDP